MKAALGFDQSILLIQQNCIQKIVLCIFRILLRRKIPFGEITVFTKTVE